MQVCAVMQQLLCSTRGPGCCTGWVCSYESAILPYAVKCGCFIRVGTWCPMTIFFDVPRCCVELKD